jgi:hypothetical protein
MELRIAREVAEVPLAHSERAIATETQRLGDRDFGCGQSGTAEPPPIMSVVPSLPAPMANRRIIARANVSLLADSTVASPVRTG